MSIHQQSFAPAKPPVLPPIETVDERVVKRQHRKAALKGISIFRRSDRKNAIGQSVLDAAKEIELLRQQKAAEHSDICTQMNAAWKSLLNNDPDTVLGMLEDEFEDNEAPAAAVACVEDEVSIVVLVPGIDILPERKPGVTAAGNLSMKKFTKAELNGTYFEVISGYVVVTIREAFAVAPSINKVSIAAVRRATPDAYAKQKLECVLASQFERKALQGVVWSSASASQVVADASLTLVANLKGKTNEIQAIDLTGHSELCELLQNYEIDAR